MYNKLTDFLTKNRSFMCDDLKAETDSLLKQLQNSAVKAGSRILKSLAFVCEILVAPVAEFGVGQKFQHRGKNVIKMYFYDPFRDWIWKPFEKRSVSLPAQLKVERFSLGKDMYDTEIQSELGNPTPIPVATFLPLLFSLLSGQPNGEAKENGLLTNGYANIFHVQLEDGRVVAVRADWDADEWDLSAFELDTDNRWHGGSCFFTLATA